MISNTLTLGDGADSEQRASLFRKLILVAAGACFALVCVGGLLWCFLRIQALVTLNNDEHAKYVDFLVYRAYRDAELDLERQLVSLPSPNSRAERFEVGPLKVRVEPVQANKVTSDSRNAVAEFVPVYNWHKSRAVFKRLEQSSPSAANQFLDGLERAGVLSHSQRSGVQSTNVIDPY